MSFLQKRIGRTRVRSQLSHRCPINDDPIDVDLNGESVEKYNPLKAIQIWNSNFNHYQKTQKENQKEEQQIE